MLAMLTSRRTYGFPPTQRHGTGTKAMTLLGHGCGLGATGQRFCSDLLLLENIVGLEFFTPRVSGGAVGS